MKKLISFLFLFLAMYAKAQTYTVTGTGITDSDGVLWANGTEVINFVPNPSQPNPGLYTLCSTGAPLSSAILNQGPTSIGSGASFSVTVYDNSAVCPAGSQWKFTTCPDASSKCGAVTLPITSAQDITSNIEANIQAPRFYATANTFGYADVEATLQLAPGNLYFNNTVENFRAWNGTAWFTLGSGGGGGTPNPPAYSIQAANTALNGFISDSLITVSTTNHTINVGGPLPTPHFILTNLQVIPGTWTFDVTTPATAEASLGPIPYTQITGPNGSTLCLVWNGASPALITTTACGGAGSVTSVGLSGSAQFTITGSPITSNGTINIALNATGTGAKAVTAPSAGTSGDCAQWAASGDLGNAAGPCATLPSTTWTDQYFSAAGCNTPNSTDGVCSGTFTIPTTEPDTSYYVYFTLNSTAGAYLYPTIYGALTTTTIPYQITCTYNCSVSTSNTVYIHVHHN